MAASMGHFFQKTMSQFQDEKYLCDKDSCDASCEQQEKSSIEREEVLGGPVFEPRLNVQRYNCVKQELGKYNVKHLVDFGCADCKISRFLVQLPTLEKLSLVDLDGFLLQSSRHAIKPLASDYLDRRNTPLCVRMYQGSVTDVDRNIVGCDAVSMVEIIEHLTPDVLGDATTMVFSKLQPRVVVITTPNSDFNILFPNFSGFRHWDHKFEWSRQEFKQWCEDICKQHPFTVEYGGVGKPPPGCEHLGCCSQVAVFTRNDKQKEICIEEVTDTYKLIAQSLYPHKEHELSMEESLLLEVQFYIRDYLIHSPPEPVLCPVCEDSDRMNSAEHRNRDGLDSQNMTGQHFVTSLENQTFFSAFTDKQSCNKFGESVENQIGSSLLKNLQDCHRLNRNTENETGLSSKTVQNTCSFSVSSISITEKLTGLCKECNRARYKLKDNEELVPVSSLMSRKTRTMVDQDQLIIFLQNHGYRLSLDKKYVIVQSESDNSDCEDADSTVEEQSDFASGTVCDEGDSDSGKAVLPDSRAVMPTDCWD